METGKEISGVSLTSSQLRYVLAAAELMEAAGRPVRGIDIAVRLGVARASACRMLSGLAAAGLLEPRLRGGLCFTDRGQELAAEYLDAYRQLTAFFKARLRLGDYDAGECAMVLLSSLSRELTDTICRRLEDGA